MTGSQKTTLDLKLIDADPQSPGSLPIRIEVSDYAISLYPQGHGDFGSEDGHGCPLFIEFYQGCLRVVAFTDIRNQEPLVIDLSGAKEDRRGSISGLHDETPLHKGRRYHDFLLQINPATGKPYTMREASAALNVDYFTVRNLEALWHEAEYEQTNPKTNLGNKHPTSEA